MFLVDDILLAPARGLWWVLEEIHHAAEKAQLSKADALTRQLSVLYAQLEAGEITEEAFEEQEDIILDALDALQEDGNRPEAEEVIGDAI